MVCILLLSDWLFGFVGSESSLPADVLWMRDRRTPKDVCGAATLKVDLFAGDWILRSACSRFAWSGIMVASVPIRLLMVWVSEITFFSCCSIMRLRRLGLMRSCSALVQISSRRLLKSWSGLRCGLGVDIVRRKLIFAALWTVISGNTDK